MAALSVYAGELNIEKWSDRASSLFSALFHEKEVFILFSVIKRKWKRTSQKDHKSYEHKHTNARHVTA